MERHQARLRAEPEQAPGRTPHCASAAAALRPPPGDPRIRWRPRPAARSRKAAIRSTSPPWAMARYQSPASRVSRRSDSVSTSKYEATDISSQVEQEGDHVVGERHEAQGEQEEVQHGAERPAGPESRRRRASTLPRRAPRERPPPRRRPGRIAPRRSSWKLTPPAIASSCGASRRKGVPMKSASMPSASPALAPTSAPAVDRRPGAPRARRDQRPCGPGDVAERHDEEERWRERHAYRRDGGVGRRSRAARIPLRMSAGSGGQPATNASTGTNWSTLPATA